MAASNTVLAIESLHSDLSNTKYVPRPLHLLVLDDDLFDRKRLKHLSQKFGLNIVVSEAETLGSLETELDQKQFDAILIDYRLGAHTGFDALDMISKSDQNAHAAKIMLSGDEHLDVAEAALSKGCDDYLAKSGLDVAKLYASICAAMAK